MFKLTNIEGGALTLRYHYIVTETIQDDERIAHISEKQLHKIVIIEFTKTLYTQRG
jgi:hypothetical protein